MIGSRISKEYTIGYTVNSEVYQKQGVLPLDLDSVAEEKYRLDYYKNSPGLIQNQIKNSQ
jgi:hypothetical protein